MNSNIYYITLIPRNQYIISYYINDNKELHIKNLKEMEKYLQNLIPKQLFLYLNELLYSFIPFFIDLEEKKIYELQVDNQKEFEDLKKRMKSNEINQVKNSIYTKHKKSKQEKFKSIGSKALDF